jgi:hypothetical protein
VVSVTPRIADDSILKTNKVFKTLQKKLHLRLALQKVVFPLNTFHAMSEKYRFETILPVYLSTNP